jgi:hypothetical protein
MYLEVAREVQLNAFHVEEYGTTGFCKKWSTNFKTQLSEGVLLLLLSTQIFHIEAMAIDTFGRISLLPWN